MSIEPWTQTLDLNSFWHETMPIQVKADLLAKRIQLTRFYKEEWTYSLGNVVELLEDLAQSDSLTNEEAIKEFDDILRKFYDYADTHRIWIDVYHIRVHD